MTPSEYIEWLDKEIENERKDKKERYFDPQNVAWCEGAINTYKEAKEKFLTIQFPISPSSVFEKRKAAIQNGFDDYCEAHDLPYRNECPLCPPLTDSLPENPLNFTDGLD